MAWNTNKRRPRRDLVSPKDEWKSTWELRRGRTQDRGQKGRGKRRTKRTSKREEYQDEENSPSILGEWVGGKQQKRPGKKRPSFEQTNRADGKSWGQVFFRRERFRC